MFAMDLPDVPPQYAPIVIAQAAQSKNPAKTERTIGVCHLIESKPESQLSAVNSIEPLGEASAYLEKQEHVKFDWKSLSWKMTLLQAPEHGELKLYEETQSGRYFATDPNYVGPDHATVLVEIGGFKVKVMYFFNLMSYVPSGTQSDPYTKENCPENARVWKISLNPDDPNAPIYTFQHPSQLTSYLAGVVNVDIQIADLANGAVGQTTGTTITLDDNAAGNGWFIDTTPGDNAEFLPTHNSNEWIAKAGSAAAGKMDMLSVLLHEYGHALGIDHSYVGWALPHHS